MLIIGSVAKRRLGILTPSVSDLDIVGSKLEFISFLKSVKVLNTLPIGFIGGHTYSFQTKQKGRVEWTIPRKGDSSDQLLNYCDAINGMHYAPLEVLYTLKMSHRFKKDSPHFYKTMEDIKVFRKHGATIFNESWLKLREKETYLGKRPNLKVKKTEFFKDDNIPYGYEHDTLHLAVMLDKTPAYHAFKEDQAEVFCSSLLFSQQPFSVKLNSIVEEAMVLALERSLIPNHFKTNQNEMFKLSLMKLCTSISSGWWRSWAWEHHNEALQLFENLGKDYLLHSFKTAKLRGILKPHIYP